MSTKSKTQKEQILSWLRRGRKLTQMKALSLFGCQALHARIGNLRKEGHKVKTMMVRTGTGKWVAEYSL